MAAGAPGSAFNETTPGQAGTVYAGNGLASVTNANSTAAAKLGEYVAICDVPPPCARRSACPGGKSFFNQSVRTRASGTDTHAALASVSCATNRPATKLSNTMLTKSAHLMIDPSHTITDWEWDIRKWDFLEHEKGTGRFQWVVSPWSRPAQTACSPHTPMPPFGRQGLRSAWIGVSLANTPIGGPTSGPGSCRRHRAFRARPATRGPLQWPPESASGGPSRRGRGGSARCKK
jgi:hypothetical protein